MKIEKYCPQCGSVGVPQRVTKGSFITELLLWLLVVVLGTTYSIQFPWFLFIIPAAIYSVWRFSSRTEACPSCLQPGMIPLDSPRAIRDLGEDTDTKDEEKCL